MGEKCSGCFYSFSLMAESAECVPNVTGQWSPRPRNSGEQYEHSHHGEERFRTSDYPGGQRRRLKPGDRSSKTIPNRSSAPEIAVPAIKPGETA